LGYKLNGATLGKSPPFGNQKMRPKNDRAHPCFIEVWFVPAIPTGLKLSAQGCEERATPALAPENRHGAWVTHLLI